VGRRRCREAVAVELVAMGGDGEARRAAAACGCAFRCLIPVFECLIF